MSGELSAIWLFRILDYEHYEIDIDGTPVCMLIVNPTDNSYTERSYEDGLPKQGPPMWRSCRAFYRWLRFHPAAEMRR